MAVQPVKRSGKKTLYGAAATAYRKARGKTKKTYKKAKTAAGKTARKTYRKGSKMFGNALSGVDPLAIGIVGVGRKDLAPYGKRLGAMVTDDALIQDEVGLLLGAILGPAIMPSMKSGEFGKVRKVLIDHEGVRLVAYMSGRGSEATGSERFPASGTGLW